MNLFAQTSCIILSAGSSGRMGRHKALLPFGSGKETFIEKITRAYANAGVEQIIVVVSAELMEILSDLKLNLSDKVKFQGNLQPELGRFNSLKSGIRQVNEDNHVFFQNIDNPFVDGKLLRQLINSKNSADVLIPSCKGKSGHPVLISPGVCQSILNCDVLENRIDDFLHTFTVSYIETEYPDILININTLKDYYIAFS